MRQAIPSNEVGDAKLIQILDDLKELKDCPKSTRLSVRANRLIYRLPDDRAESAFSSDRRQTWRSIGQRIEQVFTELFPGEWAIVDLRDCEAATVFRGQLIGPTYGDIKRKKEETKPEGAQS
jgi:hypothetical protein